MEYNKPAPLELPDGKYNAIAGGNVSVVSYGLKSYRFTFPKGVRGFNILDTITIKDNKIKSITLGDGGTY